MSTTQFCHHSPRWITEVEVSPKVLGKNCSLAQSLIGIKTKCRRTEGIIIPHKFWSEHLIDIQTDTPMRVRQIIPVIIYQRNTRSYIPCMTVHALQQFRTFNISTYYIVITRHRSDIKIIRYPKQKANFSLSLPTLHITLIVIVIAHLITYSPEI